MKLFKQLPVFIFLCVSVFTMDAQVIIDGQIDIRIDGPDIVITNRTPERQTIPRKRQPVIVTERIPAPEHPIYSGPSDGTIINQNNGPRFDYQVVDASVVQLSNYNLDLVLQLDTGDIMTIAMQESNYNDYNFHYYERPNGHNNTIYDIRLNNVSIPLNSAAVSLQPKGNRSYTAVVNLHSLYDGDFNGTVENIH